MFIIKENIVMTKSDMNLKINLGSNIDFLGYQQEIDNLTETTLLELVNSPIDIERRKFKLGDVINHFKFYFNNLISFTGATFTQLEIDSSALNMLNSFFILDYYNTYDPNTQIKIFTTYLTKIGKLPEYEINTANQLYYWYVPISYINIQTGTTAIGYVKFSFYNARNGKIIQFYNQDNAPAPVGLTPEKYYFKAELDLINKTWSFLNLTNFIVDARGSTTNSSYSDRIDNTFTKLDNVKQQYPSGSTYDYKTNKYNYLT